MIYTFWFHRSDVENKDIKGMGYPAKAAQKMFNMQPDMEYMIYSKIAASNSDYKLIRRGRKLSKEEKFVGYYRSSANRNCPTFSFVELKHHDDKSK